LNLNEAKNADDASASMRLFNSETKYKFKRDWQKWGVIVLSYLLDYSRYNHSKELSKLFFFNMK